MSAFDFDTAELPGALGAWYGTHLGKVTSACHALEGVVERPLPPVRARLVRATQLGAQASKGRGGYEIHLNAALPAIVHFAFNSLLRTPQYMYGVGDAEAEQPYRTSSERIPLALPRGLRLGQAIANIAGLSRPRDPHRAAAAVLLTEFAVAFCLYHELAHVLLGHVDAMQHATGRARLIEMSEPASPVVVPRPKLRFVWEYEADLLAANMLLQDMAGPDAERAFDDVYGTDIDTDLLSRVQAMLGAVFVVFLLVAQATPRRRRSHPEPLVRFAAVANDCVASMVEQHPQPGVGFGDVQEAINDVASSTLAAWRALGLGTSSASPLRNLLTAQRAVERLERDRLAGHTAHSQFAYFYPFR